MFDGYNRVFTLSVPSTIWNAGILLNRGTKKDRILNAIETIIMEIEPIFDLINCYGWLLCIVVAQTKP